MFRGFCLYAFKCFGYKFSKRTVFLPSSKNRQAAKFGHFFWACVLCSCFMYGLNFTLKKRSLKRKLNSIIILLFFVQNISKFLTSLPPRGRSSKLWPISRTGFSGSKQIIFLQMPRKNWVNNIHTAISLAYSCFNFFRSALDRNSCSYVIFG